MKTNIQTIPRKDKVIKRAFVPKLDVFLFFDFDQIELRLLSFYLANIGFPEMAEAIKEGKDLHAETARGALGIVGREPTDEERQRGKTLNFSTVYGGGTPTLMRQLGCTFPEAMEMLRAFHDTWPGIGWETKKKAAKRGTLAWHLNARLEERGYITTLWGRQLRPDSPHKRINVLVQGCAADLMRAAVVKTHTFVYAGYQSHLVNVIHDEIVLDCVREEVPHLVERVPKLMDHPPVSKVVPVSVAAEWSSTSWADKEPYEKEESAPRLSNLGEASRRASAETQKAVSPFETAYP